MDNQDKEGNEGKKNSLGGTNPQSSNNDWTSYTGDLGKGINSYSGEDDNFMQEVNASLAQQISSELEDNNTDTINESNKKKKMPKGLKIFTIVFSGLMLLLALLVFTPAGQKLLFTLAGNYIYNKLDYDKGNNPNGQETNNNVSVTPTPAQPAKDVINVLLIGVEEIGGASNTDSMIVASMNTKDKTVKLTSIMRDLYVEIPGHDNNKLNAAYALGGVDLLYQTLKQNFGIDIDGYMMVNFSAFEQIVDLVGGVEVSLTSTEANYLNTTNYISDPSNRRVHEGSQLMNGNQALGYCRVRKVSTGTENNDFGRTQRQRVVLNAIFDKLKSKNLIQLGLFMNDVLTKVEIKTDINNSDFNNYMQWGASMNLKELQNYRIPSDGSYGSIKVRIGKYNQDVLVPTDWDATRTEIHNFIYGSGEAVASDVTVTPTDEPSSGQ
ncbi:LCP family protein [Anaerocolumna xylanovorans]|uniref:Transcriptional attenuator, LytR family n=1 Tax=Anaerocolumna xylanovorans DSM 12503 TaxID=1121345 RepID=A0A1M7YFF9_9FIRM|nr:LCP family protein [Anaerocolumna xylanovorans]SHO51248.1 transcriptional attenuator, LytR family [Anaerocolumna xylanovorans DSM 12503]